MNIYKTSDLALAAFLTMRGLRLVSAGKLANGNFNFEIEDPGGKAHDLSIEYLSSELCEFDNKIRTLKKLLYSR
tara:strand:- start:149 stop:370 length:222 start_codon:yes stop_codon:yes gene_type:complete